MKKEMKIFIAANALVALAVALFAVIASIAIHYGVYKCALLETFHIYCPGCGGTRALFALFHFDILSSLRYNPILIVGIFVYAFYDIRIFENFDKAYRDGLFDKVFTTNLVYRMPELKKREWYCEVELSKYLSYIIDTLNHD